MSVHPSPTLRVVIISRDAVGSSALAFAAERRGHQTVLLESVDRLFGRLPFTPGVIVLAANASYGQELKQLARISEAFPGTAIFLTAEKPREPFPALVVQAGAHLVREPYNSHELVLEAERWLGEREGPAGGEYVTVADIEVALEQYSARKNGAELSLTKLELRLLFCLCDHFPNLAPLERLLTFGWETLGDPDASLLKTHISHIRRKLAAAGGVECEIVSRQTIGYVLRLA